MKIKDCGHVYTLDALDGGAEQEIRFVKRVGDGFPFNHAPAYGGTNCQEVLRVLIDRVDYLQRQKPCAESESISALLKTALMLFESRAARLHGHTLELRDLMECVSSTTCSTCGHVKCEAHLTGKE